MSLDTSSAGAGSALRDGDRPQISLIIPTLNEEKCLLFLVPRIPAGVDEVILVDGHSTDRTVEVAKQLRPTIKILYQPGRGKGDALRHALLHAQGDVIVTLDADGSMDPGEISRFVRPILDGYDYVKGSRFLPGGGTEDMTAHRRFGNWVFTVLVNLLCRTRYTDLCYGYNAFRRDVVGRLDLRADGFDVETEMNIRASQLGLRVVELPSFERRRFHGSGKLRSLRDGAMILLTVLRSCFRRGNGRHAPTQGL